MKQKHIYIIVSLVFGAFGLIGGWFLKSSRTNIIQTTTLSKALGLADQNAFRIEVGGEANECLFVKSEGSWSTLLDEQIAKLLELPVMEVKLDQEEILDPAQVCGTRSVGCESFYGFDNSEISFSRDGKINLKLHLPWNYHACKEGLCPDFVVLTVIDTEGKSRSFVASWNRWQHHRLKYQTQSDSIVCEW